MGLPGRRRRELRHRHLAHAAGAPSHGRVVVRRLLALDARRARRSRPGSASRRTPLPRSPRSSASATAGGSGSPRVSALGQYFGSQSALRDLVRPLTRVSRRQPLDRKRDDARPRPALGRLPRRELLAPATRAGRAPADSSARAAFYAKSDYFDEPLPAKGRQVMIDWIERRQRTPATGSGALLLDAYGGAYNRPRPGATAFAHRDMLFSLQYGAYLGNGPASNRWINGVWRALRPYASGQAYQNYIDPQLTTWQKAYYAGNLPASCARSRSRSIPTSCFASSRRFRRPADVRPIPGVALGGTRRDADDPRAGPSCRVVLRELSRGPRPHRTRGDQCRLRLTRREDADDRHPRHRRRRGRSARGPGLAGRRRARAARAARPRATRRPPGSSERKSESRTSSTSSFPTPTWPAR